jgi:methionyl-tRNA formyltransferase
MNLNYSHKKIKITFLLDKSNLWFEKQLKKYDFKLSHKYKFSISKNYKIVKKQDIVFPLSYTKILPNQFLKENKLVLIAHSSKLPKDKGFAPLQNQLLKNKKYIYISLIKAVPKIDAGPIYLQEFFYMDGTELIDEIRKKQGIALLNIIKKFLIKYPNVSFKKQQGKSSFNKRRHPKDSRLNINKTIKEQFNHLRINDNEIYPSFFIYKNTKYLIKIYKK